MGRGSVAKASYSQTAKKNTVVQLRVLIVARLTVSLAAPCAVSFKEYKSNARPNGLLSQNYDNPPFCFVKQSAICLEPCVKTRDLSAPMG